MKSIRSLLRALSGLFTLNPVRKVPASEITMLAQLLGKLLGDRAPSRDEVAEWSPEVFAEKRAQAFALVAVHLCEQGREPALVRNIHGYLQDYIGQ